MAAGVIIDPQDLSLTVTIKGINGSLINLFNDLNCQVPLTNPVTVTGGLGKIFVKESTVSTTISLVSGGVELATSAGATLPYTFSDNEVGSIAPVSFGRAGAAGTFQPIPAQNLKAATSTKVRKVLAASQVLTTTGGMKLLCLGDSTTAGKRSTGVNIDSYPGVLVRLLTAAGIPAVPGLAIPPYDPTNSAVFDNRWAAGTGWTLAGNAGWAQQVSYTAPTTATGSLTFTPKDTAGLGLNVNTFDIYYLTNPSIGQAVATVDGLTPTTLTGQVANGIAKTTITVAAGSSHVLSIAPPTLGSFYVTAVEAYLSTSPAVRVGNVGVSGSSTGQWNQTGAQDSLAGIALFAPDLMVVSLGINDAAGGSVSVSTWSSNMSAIINKGLLTGDAVLMSCVPGDPSTVGVASATRQNDYQAASLGLAQSLGVSYIDIRGRLVDYPTASAQGYFDADKIHLTPRGNADVARPLARALASV